MTISGIDPLAATALAAAVGDGKQFSGRATCQPGSVWFEQNVQQAENPTLLGISKRGSSDF